VVFISLKYCLVAGTYIPRKEVSVQELLRASVIRKNQALKLRAVKEMKDQEGNCRVTGITNQKVYGVESSCYYFWVSFNLDTV